MAKKKTAVIKRWWNYSLVRGTTEEGGDAFVLAEVYWKQEGKKKPKIWFCNDAILAAPSQEDVVELLQVLADELKVLPVIDESELPDEEEAEKEYEEVIAQHADCDKSPGCGGGCCS